MPTSLPGNLQDIITKIREISASGNSLQVTDEKIIKYLNSYYLYDLPQDLRLLKLKDVYTFNTIQGIDTYPFDYIGWSTVQPPAYSAKQQMAFYQDPALFYGSSFNLQVTEQFTSGNGTNGAITGVITNITQALNAVVTSNNHGLSTGNQVFITNVTGMVEVNNTSFIITVIDANTFNLNVDSLSYGVYTGGGDWLTSAYVGTTQGSPILRSVNNNPMATTLTAPTTVFPNGYPPTSLVGVNTNISRIQNILITANTETSSLHVTDDGAGNLIGNCNPGGTINYQTGAIAGLTFTQAVPSGNPIYIEYKAITLGQPFSILFFQQQFILRPVPDKAYTIEMIAYRTPSQILMGTEDPNAVDLNGTPEDFEWWELIAFGVAKKLYQDRLDMQGVALMQQFIDEQVSNARTTTYGQLSKQRVPNIFQDQSARLVDYGYNTGFAFGNSVNS